MKRIDIVSKQAPNFIGCWDIEDSVLCDDMIGFFEQHQDLQGPGATGSGIRPEHKRSTDIAINPNDIAGPEYQVFADYFDRLHTCFLDYKEQWPFLDTFLDRVQIGSFNVQRYLPGEHFSNLHSERTHLSKLHRILAFMTYLNDVSEGGTTDFLYYDLKVRPEKGKTLIWPAEWTHAHSGSVVEGGEKYIITGWMHFPTDPKA